MAPATFLDTPNKTDGRLPVILLSGFLRLGKTTLLENILMSPDHGLRIGVIVNDVGSLNIDAALLSFHDVTRKEEQVVAMQNGCICCTLRGDLLEEVARLAEEKQVEYLVIESSGVSEPMQVAETLSEEFAEMHVAAGYDLEAEEQGDLETNKKLAEIMKAGRLSKVARLDTCVTLVDAVNFMQDFAAADFLVDRQADVPQEDDRNISDLQGDEPDDDDDDDTDMEDQPQPNPKARLASKMADETFGPLLRSKGFLWLATRPRIIPEDEWPETRKAITRDFVGKWGDRRQELVFIGQQMRKGARITFDTFERPSMFVSSTTRNSVNERQQWNLKMHKRG
ncbi:cobW-domain-containing protein [Hypoxylon cercidicola]|nr:cobW-domain-containing protein [Hypoxylon cercidicola]